VDIFRSQRGQQAIKSGLKKAMHDQSSLYISAASGTLRKDLHRFSCWRQYNLSYKHCFATLGIVYIAESDMQIDNTYHAM
jgi:hypothetical protein